MKSSGFGVIAAALILGGCAFGQRYDYSAVSINAPVAEPKAGTPLTVMVHDRRPYVVSGGKGPTFVGLSRGGFGNPFDVHTASGQPLSVDMAEAVARALQSKGFTVLKAHAQPRDSQTEVRRQLVNRAPARRLVLLSLAEWKSDLMINVDLHYDMTLTVYDEKGEQLASASRKGMDSLGRAGHAGVPPAFARKVEALLEEPAVAAALKV